MAKKFCVVGYYFGPEEIIEATRRTRERGFQKFDSFTPFPVHGMDAALGIKRSCLPYLSFIAGATGLAIAFGLQVWTHYYSWPMNVGGKPLFALPAYVPILFELTVLLCGLATAGGMFTLFLNLPNFSKPIFHPDITNDRFALAIEVDSESEVESVKGFLREIQSADIHAVEGRL